MEQIKAEFIDKMGDDLRAANIARVSFNKWKTEFDEQDAKLITYLAAHEHTSPFRHLQLSIRCHAPIYLSRQLGKHQVGMSWNEVSRRYVSDNVELFKQDFRLRPDNGIKQGSSLEEGKYPDVWIGEHCFPIEMVLDALVEAYEVAVDDNGLHKIAPECARATLPQSMMTSWVWTGSLISFYHMVRLRRDGHAQKEAQYFANQVEKICMKHFPHCWKALLEN